MRSDSLERIFQRDLDRLPGLAEADVLPRGQRRRPGLGSAAAVAGCVLLAVVLVASVRASSDGRATQPDEQLGTDAHYIADAGVAAASSTAPTLAPLAHDGAPVCPAGQLPWIAVANPPAPGSQPGTGASSAEAAFRRANPSITEFTMYPWGAREPAQGGDPRLGRGPVWIVAGAETYIAQAPGGPGDVNNWFAYRARFMGCRTPPPGTVRPIGGS